MLPWLAWFIAVVSTSVCLLLWFRDVRRVMRNRKSMVESAAGQRSVCRQKADQARGDPDAAAVFERSENIYRQAVEHYNHTMRKPWNYLPAYLMGFRLMQ